MHIAYTMIALVYCKTIQAREAAEIVQAKPQTGVYIIDDVCAHKETFQEQATVRAKCDVEGEDSGWLVIMRRDNTIASSQYVSFSRDWVEYVNGFGNLNTEFWYGLRNMHCLTSREEVDLRINFKKNDGTEETYVYHTFRVGGAHTNYALTIGGLQTPAPGSDRMAFHNGAAFSTRDADHDTWGNGNCAASASYGGGWWYQSCSHSAFNNPHSSSHKVRWGISNYANVVEMQVRAKTCAAN